MRRAVRVLTCFALAAVSLGLTVPTARASVTSVVISTGDQAFSSGVFQPNDCSGGSRSTCTLRAAIQRANTNGGGAIDFNIAGSGVHTIHVGSTGLGTLPAIGQSGSIDSTTQPGYAGASLIELDGINAGSSSVGLDLTAGSSRVRASSTSGMPRPGRPSGPWGITRRRCSRSPSRPTDRRSPAPAPTA